jgi:anaerobic C4-dicarboxylate transporter
MTCTVSPSLTCSPGAGICFHTTLASTVEVSSATGITSSPASSRVVTASSSVRPVTLWMANVVLVDPPPESAMTATTAAIKRTIAADTDAITMLRRRR